MKINKSKLSRLDQAGLAHFLLPLIVIILVSVVGVYMLVGSHADPQTAFGSKQAPPPPTSPVKAIAKQISTRSSKASTINDERQAIPQNSPTPPDQPGVIVSNTALTGTPRPTYAAIKTTPIPPPPPPTGNLTVITYLNDPTQPGLKNSRIGGVKVDVKRNVGQNFCSNRQNKTEASTNKTQYKGKVLVHGSAHYIDCSTGDYTVKLIGRKGYRPVKGLKTTKTASIENDNTTTVIFILNKITTSTSTTTIQ